MARPPQGYVGCIAWLPQACSALGSSDTVWSFNADGYLLNSNTGMCLTNTDLPVTQSNGVTVTGTMTAFYAAMVPTSSGKCVKLRAYSVTGMECAISAGMIQDYTGSTPYCLIPLNGFQGLSNADNTGVTLPGCVV